MTVFEFTAYLQFEAEDEDDARDQLISYCRNPGLDVYAIGIDNAAAPRLVEEEAVA